MANDGGKPILVGVDGSASSARAVRWAAAEARRRRRRVRLVYGNVAPLIHEGRPPMPVAMPQSFAEAMRTQGEEWLEQAETAARTEAPDLELDSVVRTGAAAWVLVEESKSAALVVVGSRGLGGFTGLGRV